MKVMELPETILQKQVCDECCQYLSVGPVTVNARGEAICGRCNNGSGTKSLFNTVSDMFAYKCTNHLDGCPAILPPSEMQEHEKTCFYQPQDCLKCSFSGNLSQIFNHFVKTHANNIAFDGAFPFFLSDDQFKEKMLYRLENSLCLITVEMNEEIFQLSLKVLAKNLAEPIRQYGLKFFDRSDPDQALTEFGVFHNKFDNYFKLNKGELLSFFGSGSIIICQVIVEDLSLETKELEFQKRFDRLRCDERVVSDSKKELKQEIEGMRRKSKTFDVATNIIKLMSFSMFQCRTCKKTAPTEMYYCPNFHCFCKKCLNIVCSVCETTRQFQRLYVVEDFEVACDFMGCQKTTKIKDYLEHKSKCSKRSYKCPVETCSQIISSAFEFINHWHSDMPRLYVENKGLKFKGYLTEECYWMVNNDLYRVLVKFDALYIQVLIEEVSVVSNATIKCQGYAQGNEPSNCSATSKNSTTSRTVLPVPTSTIFSPTLTPYNHTSIFGGASNVSTASNNVGIPRINVDSASYLGAASAVSTAGYLDTTNKWCTLQVFGLCGKYQVNLPNSNSTYTQLLIYRS